jgi:hypothetical protein
MMMVMMMMMMVMMMMRMVMMMMMALNRADPVWAPPSPPTASSGHNPQGPAEE